MSARELEVGVVASSSSLPPFNKFQSHQERFRRTRLEMSQPWPDRRAAIRLAAMASVEVQGVEGMQALVGQEIGPSEWRTVTQQDINAFADLSGDDQWIHVDVERAKAESPFGTTIAHGNLTLSLVDGFRKELISSSGFALGVNYGWNKIRFPAPVPVDARVRGRAEVVSIDEKGGGWWEVVTRFTLEVEGNEKPAFVGDSVGRALVAQS